VGQILRTLTLGFAPTSSIAREPIVLRYSYLRYRASVWCQADGCLFGVMVADQSLRQRIPFPYYSYPSIAWYLPARLLRDASRLNVGLYGTVLRQGGLCGINHEPAEPRAKTLRTFSHSQPIP